MALQCLTYVVKFNAGARGWTVPVDSKAGTKLRAQVVDADDTVDADLRACKLAWTETCSADTPRARLAGLLDDLGGTLEFYWRVMPELFENDDDDDDDDHDRDWNADTDKYKTICLYVTRFVAALLSRGLVLRPGAKRYVDNNMTFSEVGTLFVSAFSIAVCWPHLVDEARLVLDCVLVLLSRRTLADHARTCHAWPYFGAVECATCGFAFGCYVCGSSLCNSLLQSTLEFALDDDPTDETCLAIMDAIDIVMESPCGTQDAARCMLRKCENASAQGAGIRATLSGWITWRGEPRATWIRAVVLSSLHPIKKA